MPEPTTLPPSGMVHASCYGSHVGREKSKPSLPIKEITERASWPTFNRASLFNLPSEAAFLANLHESNRWHDVGLHWRNRFLLSGEVYRRRASKQIFRVLRAGTGSVLVWPLQDACRAASQQFSEQIEAEPAPVQRLASPVVSPVRDCFFYTPSPPAWVSLTSWDDFEALPCTAISPLATFAQLLCPTPAVGVWLQQTEAVRTVLQHAAFKGFQGLTDADLKTLAKERTLDISGSSPWKLLSSLVTIYRN